ncbi:MAG: 3,4-dihydroxy-2-butanone-4-phosphate synthase [Candidatus Heimdallarchaeota archaeon]|nr:3,4-dihydroxy-2-butanone-4-phosphate synthase [Candidatus Heimdallarchaeota archaeon]
MFEILNQIKEAWNNNKFILLYDSDKREGEVDMVLPSQLIQPYHIAELREHAGGLICTALADEICRNITLPFLSTIYEAMSSVYPIINLMSSHKLPYGAKSSFSVSVNHVKAFTGITDVDRALTISALGEISDKFATSKLTRVEITNEFGSTFRIPGHVPILRGAHGLMKKRKGHTELSLALCEITNHAPSATMCEMMDSKNNKALSIEDAKNLGEQFDFPYIDGKTIINLWRSIKKINKNEIIPDYGEKK